MIRPTNLQYSIFCRSKISEYAKTPKILFPTTSYNPTTFPTNLLTLI